MSKNTEYQDRIIAATDKQLAMRWDLGLARIADLLSETSPEPDVKIKQLYEILLELSDVRRVQDMLLSMFKPQEKPADSVEED